MSLRRPSSASSDANPSRMPFASAEGLLWGPEMKQQHAYLLTEMRALQKQHEAYDARIRTSEAAADAAEAATLKIRHMEQQLAAIEAEDDDKAFEKWVAGEITRLGIFVDTNKNVRQNQIQLTNEVSGFRDELSKLTVDPTDFKATLRRLDLIEAGQNDDARRIRRLEAEVNHLKTMRRGSGSGVLSIPDDTRKQNTIRKAATVQPLEREILDSTTEPEDEDLVPLRQPAREEVQVSRSPEFTEKHVTQFSTRPSIHDTMLPRLLEEEGQHEGSALEPGPLLRRAVSPPPTQLVCHERLPAGGDAPALRSRPIPNKPATPLSIRANPKKRKQADAEAFSPRLTRSRAKKGHDKESEHGGAPGEDNISVIPPTQLVNRISSSRKKPKTAPVQHPAQSKAAPSIATQVTTRSPRKTKQPNAADGSGKNTSTEPTQLITENPTGAKGSNAASVISKTIVPKPRRLNDTSPTKQKQLIVVLPTRPADTQKDHSDSNHLQISTADRVDSLPRKAANPSTSKVIPKPVRARKKNPQAIAVGGPSRYSRGADAVEGNLRMSPRRTSPRKLGGSGL
ncbi:hypothetical protein BDW02DRAFT_511929 [Decorospora gaudefroyi]|uniref:Uncharacterized protein n=1 Tax=Decorospora gaudefroyi TaxID=184978 RepID=A0A6A5K301_9PLEO|nr:hypothetical protein BDW02DRAFT_511929 [Decorospora gaudefroyi]